MLATNPVGREAQSRKYDILTALGAHACAGEPGLQRLSLRLLTLITARYNWRANELSIGRADIARLWAVNERTVKRELAKLKAMGWLSVKRPAARGRVTVYGLEMASMLRATSASWASVGSDFQARMELLTGAGQGAGQGNAPDPTTPDAGNVVPFRGRLPEGGSVWARAAALLQAEDAALFGAWLAALTEFDGDGGTLELLAPSRFHARYVETHFSARIRAALARVEPGLQGLRITAL